MSIKRLTRCWLTTAALVAAMITSPVLAQKKEAGNAKKAADTSKKAPEAAKKSAEATKKATAAGASAADIEAAKKKGLVWVNTETGVYHKDGRWYGKTKAGKFMTEAEAKKAGHTEAKR